MRKSGHSLQYEQCNNEKLRNKMLIFETGSELTLIILSYVATFAQTTTPSSPVTSRNNINHLQNFE